MTCLLYTSLVIVVIEVVEVESGFTVYFDNLIQREGGKHDFVGKKLIQIEGNHQVLIFPYHERFVIRVIDLEIERLVGSELERRVTDGTFNQDALTVHHGCLILRCV